MKQHSSLFLPISIVVAGLLIGIFIAGAIIYSNRTAAQSGVAGVETEASVTKEMERMASAANINRRNFNACLAGEESLARVDEDNAEASDQGTPYNVIYSDFATLSVAGALPLEIIDAIVVAIQEENQAALDEIADTINTSQENAGYPPSIVFSDFANYRAPNSDDHIRGSLDAPIILVEYSDFDCPFCARFHGTMKSVLSTHGESVAWIYRHRPIPQLMGHEFSPIKARASECIAELAENGNDAFWQFADNIFGVTS